MLTAAKAEGERARLVAGFCWEWSRPEECPCDNAIERRTVRSREVLQDLGTAEQCDEDRMVILLTRIQEMSHAEAAKQLGRTEGATRVLLFRAIARLAKKLGAG